LQAINSDAPTVLVDDSCLLKSGGDSRHGVALHTDHACQHFLVSGKRSLSHRSRASSSQCDKRASTEWHALHAADCWACAIKAAHAVQAGFEKPCIDRQQRERSRHPEPRPNLAAEQPASLNDMASPNAAAAPAILSRPTIASSIL